LTDPLDILTIIVAVYVFFSGHALAFSTGRFEWLIASGLIGVGCAVVLAVRAVSRARVKAVLDGRLDQFTRIVHTQFPAYRIKVHGWSADDPGIRHFVHVTGVPQDRLVAVEDRCWDIATEVYGAEGIPQ